MNEEEQYRQELADNWENLDSETAVEEQAVESRQEDEQKEQDAGLPPSVQEMLSKIEDRLASFDSTFSYRLKQAENRIGSLQNSIRDELKQAKAAAAQSADAPTAKEMQEASQDEERWKALKGEYPEWADVMEGMDKRFKSRAEKVDIPDVNAIRDEIKNEFAGKLTKVQQDFEVRLVGIAHKDWRDVIKTAEYNEWLQKQPQDVRDRTRSDLAEDAIYVLDAFKSATAPKKEETPSRLARAVSTPSSGKATKTKPEDAMTDEEYRRHLTRQYEKL